MLVAVVALQRRRDLLLVRAYSRVPQFGQRHGVPFASYYPFYYHCPGFARDVGDGLVKAKIHLLKSLLHALHVCGNFLDKHGAMPGQSAKLANLVRWTEVSLKKAIRTQPLYSLAVIYIRLGTPGNTLQMTRINKRYFESFLFEKLVQRNPIYAGRFHRHA